MGKSIIVFYSKSGENIANGTVVNLEVGNTEVAADMIANFVEADKFKVEMVKPYASGYMDCTAQAKLDQSTKARPEIKNAPESLDEYDTIYLGYPNYWGTMPMAMFTFLEKYDLSGKIIKPFCTHEGSGLGESINDLQAIAPDAIIREGLAIHGADVRGYKFTVKKWVSRED